MLITRIATISSLAIGLGASACVTSGTHEALQKEYDETKQAMRADINERNARITNLEEQLAAEEAMLRRWTPSCRRGRLHWRALKRSWRQRAPSLRDSTRALQCG